MPVATASGGHAGSLDRTFGDDGVLTADFGTEPTAGAALAVIADKRGRLLVLQPGVRGIAVARYFVDGRLDSSFGDGGIALDRSDQCYGEGSIGLGPGGTIVASCGAAIVRFTASGRIDRDYGVNGLIRAEELVRWRQEAWDIDLSQSVTQAEGGTVAMYASDSFATVVRFDADGRLDRSYGQDGRARLRGPYFEREPVRLLGLPNGKLLFAASGSVDTSQGLIVGRLDADGRPDPSFGTGGFTETRALEDGPQGLALLPDGSFYVAGFENRFVHVSATGVWDRTFGGNGFARGPAKQLGTVHSIIATPDGGLLAAGTLSQDRYGPARLLLERFTADGFPSPGFGPDGSVTAEPKPGRRHEARALIELPDGGVVAVGVAGPPGTDLDPSQVTLAAFRPDGQLDRRFGEKGAVLTPATSPSSDSVTALLVDNRGRTVVVGRAGGGSAVVRFGRRGGRDASFGSDGLVRLPAVGDARSATGTALAPAPGGRLLVGIGSYEAGGVFRLGRRGHLDDSFGVGGLAGGRLFEWVTDLVATGEGGFLAAGSKSDSIVGRFGSRGRLDPGYGRDGTITVAHLGEGDQVPLARAADGTLALLAGRGKPAEYGPRGHRLGAFAPPVHARAFRRRLPVLTKDLAFDHQGRLLLAGVRHGRVATSRLLPNGRLDRSFGDRGLVLTPVGAHAEADRIDVEADGRIVVAGLTLRCPYRSSCQRGRAITLRYLASGALDRSFGDRGRFVDRRHKVVAVTALAIEPGSITIGGTAEPGVEDRQFYVARLSR
ncbi:MAG TPA: hypothetical protein VGW80_05545 [Solirubrobacterales bacterium]|nr:hypothetical protein [Solirubrobacterales bacterium]